jgi:hypothetical protein
VLVSSIFEALDSHLAGEPATLGLAQKTGPSSQSFKPTKDNPHQTRGFVQRVGVDW